MIRDDELYDLVTEGRSALAAPTFEKVSATLDVFPRMLDALDRLSRHTEALRAVRTDLTIAVHQFREEVWNVQKAHPEVTYRAAHIHASTRHISAIIDRLEAIINEE